MKKLLTSILTLALVSTMCFASEESEFIKAHITAFAELNLAAQNFERELLSIKSKDTALKYIDQYSLSIEKALPVYEKYKQAKSDLIKEVSTDFYKMLFDIMNNNYELLGKLVKKDFDNSLLQSECQKLVEKNKYISNFLKDVSIGVCMTTVKDKPKSAKENEQFSRLTLNERDEINNLLIEKLGKEISKAKKESTKTPFEYSCVAIYEFLNMEWKFAKG
jgi:hypothetical protein